jgi:hypothetical protein
MASAERRHAFLLGAFALVSLAAFVLGLYIGAAQSGFEQPASAPQRAAAARAPVAQTRAAPRSTLRASSEGSWRTHTSSRSRRARPTAADLEVVRRARGGPV